MVNDWSIFDLLAPACPICGLPGGQPCVGCHADLPCLPRVCLHCALPLDLAEPNSLACCPRCGRTPPPLERVIAAHPYAFPLDALVQQLKFGGRLPLARVLGDLLAEAVVSEQALPLPAALLPVPLHPARERQRGFNQATQIARRVGRRLEIPVMPRALLRHQDTAAQSGLNLRQRRRNLRGAFGVQGALPAHVALVDDVMTTGSTLRELALTLRAAGVERVDAWVVARTI